MLDLSAHVSEVSRKQYAERSVRHQHDALRLRPRKKNLLRLGIEPLRYLLGSYGHYAIRIVKQGAGHTGEPSRYGSDMCYVQTGTIPFHDYALLPTKLDIRRLEMHYVGMDHDLSTQFECEISRSNTDRR